LLRVVDDLAGVLTGNREYFHLPMAGAHTNAGEGA
jgi:hypothetical protein